MEEHHGFGYGIGKELWEILISYNHPNKIAIS